MATKKPRRKATAKRTGKPAEKPQASVAKSQDPDYLYRGFYMPVELLAELAAQATRTRGKDQSDIVAEAVRKHLKSSH